MQILVLLLVVHGLFVTPWILQNLFNWYLYDMFNMYMTYKQAMGIEFIHSFITISFCRRTDNKNTDKALELVLGYTLGVWLLFVVAFIIKEFILNG